MMLRSFLPPVDPRPLFAAPLNVWYLIAFAPTYLALGVAVLLICKRSTRGVGIALAGAFLASGVWHVRTFVEFLIFSATARRTALIDAALSRNLWQVLMAAWWFFFWCVLAWKLTTLGGHWRTDALCPKCRTKLDSDATKCGRCGTRVRIETIAVAEPLPGG